MFPNLPVKLFSSSVLLTRPVLFSRTLESARHASASLRNHLCRPRAGSLDRSVVLFLQRHDREPNFDANNGPDAAEAFRFSRPLFFAEVPVRCVTDPEARVRARVAWIVPSLGGFAESVVLSGR